MTGQPVRRGERPRSLDPRLDASDKMRALELHEAGAHAHGGRRVMDLGDAVLLHDPLERDPFMNRMSGIRLPSDAAGFDRRLTELVAFFGSLGRRPHVWLSPAFHSPADLGARLIAEGFGDLGGTYAMVLSARRFADVARDLVTLPSEAHLESLSRRGLPNWSLLRGAARVIAEAFGSGPGGERQLAEDLAGMTSPARDVCVLWLGDQPVAAGRRYTADGMTYLSSIGTRPHWWGHGFASAVTAALTQDGRAAGGSLVHLGVEWDNARALAMYQRLGFEVLGDRIADLLLE
jgi:ribosomal protein S18 acetylase RimI-like enzyme